MTATVVGADSRVVCMIEAVCVGCQLHALLMCAAGCFIYRMMARAVADAGGDMACPQVRQSGNIDAECQNAQKATQEEDKCPFFGKASRLKDELAHSHIWDIEDLDKARDELEGCRFYATRELLKDEVDLIICPYNYIFDPHVRKAMGIELMGCAVVIDEGHNIEDVCREAASLELSLPTVQTMATELKEMQKYFSGRNRVDNLTALICLFEGWLVGMSSRGAPAAGTTWRGLQGLGLLQEHVHAGGRSLEHLALAATSEAERLQEVLSEQRKQGWGAETLGTAVQLLRALSMLICVREQTVDDLRMHVGPTQGGSGGMGWALWCLNPARVFKPIAELCRCVILTSGTLSPMESFSGELGCRIPLRLEAPHIIPERQLLVQAVGELGELTYKTTNQPHFPTQLGRLLLQYCQRVPHGALCFLPSYSLMRTITTSWQGSGLWAELDQCKPIVMEPRGSANFEAAMEQFYSAVSEGINFKYENARAIFMVGIPCPSVNDPRVTHKK
eukprot:gene19517-23339_t